MQNYVYAYINPIDSQIFYIGKGSNKRAWRHLCDSKNLEKHESYRYFYRKINKIRQLILRDPDVQLLYTGLDAETAYSIEENLIQTLGRKGLHHQAGRLRKGAA